MSDQHWQAPTSGAWTPPQQPGAVPPPGGYAPPGPQAPPMPPGYQAPPPGYQAPPPGFGAPYGAPGGWTPPPKPGLLPLRPLDFGALMWAPFRTLRRNPGPVFGSGLLVQLAVAIATAAAFIPFFITAFTRLETANSADQDEILAGTFGGTLLLMLVPMALSVVGGAFLQGVMVIEVATGTLGEKLRFGELWRRAAKRIWPLIGWTLIVGVVLTLVILLFAGIVVLGVAVGGPVGAGIAVLVVILLMLGMVVLGAWIGVKLSLVPSAIVLERMSVGAAIRRSWRLTDRYFWRTFGVEILVAFILNFAAQVITTPIGFIGGIVIALVDPTGTGASIGIMIGIYLLTIIVSLITGAVISVVQAAVVAVIYLDLRMRKEGLDLELARHVEARDAGYPVGDPFEPRPQPFPASAPSGWA